MDRYKDKVRAKKHLGQHFLIDLNIARKITEAIGRTDEQSAEEGAKSGGESKVVGGEGGSGGERKVVGGEGGSGRENKVAKSGRKSDAGKIKVLEVGPGMGVLTQFLLKREDLILYAAEIDAESIQYLNTHYPQLTPRLIEDDFLKLDLKEMFPDGVSIIGNFPYNISSQIFFKVIQDRDIIPEVVGMVQREVAVRIAEPPGSRAYGILSVLLQAWYDIEYLFTVNEGVFNPPPKVKSAVLRLTRNNSTKLGCDEKLFVKVVKASFGQRRKMLRNSLKSVFGTFNGAEHRFFTQRAEQLSVKDFVELTNWVAENTSHLQED